MGQRPPERGPSGAGRLPRSLGSRTPCAGQQLNGGLGPGELAEDPPARAAFTAAAPISVGRRSATGLPSASEGETEAGQSEGSPVASPGRLIPSSRRRLSSFAFWRRWGGTMGLICSPPFPAPLTSREGRCLPGDGAEGAARAHGTAPGWSLGDTGSGGWGGAREPQGEKAGRERCS